MKINGRGLHHFSRLHLYQTRLKINGSIIIYRNNEASNEMREREREREREVIYLGYLAFKIPFCPYFLHA
jgi:MinD superfamily P-loop ATPase